MLLDPSNLDGKLVVSGTGEQLGHVVGVDPDAHGRPRKLRFRDDEDQREVAVKLEFVRAVRGDRVELKGPREGFHITRLSRSRGASSDGNGL